MMPWIFVYDYIKLYVFKNIRENNIINNALLSILLGMVGYISKYPFWVEERYNKFIEHLKGVFPYCYYEPSLEFVGTEHMSGFSHKITRATDTYYAIMWKINTHIKSKDIRKITCLKEKVSQIRSYIETEDLDFVVDQTSSFDIPFEKNRVEFKLSKIDEEIDKERYTSITMHLTVLKDPVTRSWSNIRKLLFLKNFVNEAHQEYSQHMQTRETATHKVFVFEEIDHNDNCPIYSEYPFSTSCNIDNVHMENKEDIMKIINRFESEKSWYYQRGIPYTLGILTHGPPGCGKTSFEKALAKKLERHLIILDLAKINTQSICDSLFFDLKINGKTVPYDKRIYLIPDVDKMVEWVKAPEYQDLSISIKEREKEYEKDGVVSVAEKLGEIMIENRKSSGGGSGSNNSKKPTDMNLSKFLNILDGIPERTGQIVIMSANRPEILDPALMRPGRMDLNIHFKKASFKVFCKLVANFYQISEEEVEENFEKKIKLIEGKMTPAEIYEKCNGSLTISSLVSGFN